jgi:hypothetical protein
VRRIDAIFDIEREINFIDERLAVRRERGAPSSSKLSRVKDSLRPRTSRQAFTKDAGSKPD